MPLRERMGIVSIVVYVLCAVMLFAVWLSETGNLPGRYNKEPREFVFGMMVVMTVILGLMGGALGALLAVFPHKGRTYWERFARRLPFGLFPVMTLACIGSMFSAITWNTEGYALAEKEQLASRPVPRAIDCLRVHEGSFEAYGVTFVRKAAMQDQFDARTQERSRFDVHWKDACTYRLVRAGTTDTLVTVHITHVHAEGGYRCLVDWRDGGVMDLDVRPHRTRFSTN